MIFPSSFPTRVLSCASLFIPAVSPPGVENTNNVFYICIVSVFILFKAYIWKNLKAEEKTQGVHNSKPNVLAKFVRACANVTGKQCRT